MDAMGVSTYVDTELDRALLPAVLQGEFRLVLISGNAGDGKTAFLQRLEKEVEARGGSANRDFANGSELALADKRYLINYDGSQDEGNKDNNQVLLDLIELKNTRVTVGGNSVNTSRLRRAPPRVISMYSTEISGTLAISASLMKMVWLPVLCTFAAWLVGFRGAELGILFLYFASPTAAASYVMARAANGNHELAAAIIVITTLMAAITTNIGIFVLQWGGWI